MNLFKENLLLFRILTFLFILLIIVSILSVILLSAIRLHTKPKKTIKIDSIPYIEKFPTMSDEIAEIKSRVSHLSGKLKENQNDSSSENEKFSIMSDEIAEIKSRLWHLSAKLKKNQNDSSKNDSSKNDSSKNDIDYKSYEYTIKNIFNSVNQLNEYVNNKLDHFSSYVNNKFLDSSAKLDEFQNSLKQFSARSSFIPAPPPLPNPNNVPPPPPLPNPNNVPPPPPLPPVNQGEAVKKKVISALPAVATNLAGELQENFAKIKDKDDNSSVKVSDLLPSGGTRYKKEQIAGLKEYKKEKEKAKDDDSGPTVNDLSGSEKKKNELDTNDTTEQNQPSSSINEANSSRTIKDELNGIDFQAILS